MQNKSDIFKEFNSFQFVKTPLVCVNRYVPAGNVFLKLEGENLFGNIKARCAFYMLQDIVNQRSGSSHSINVVESSSGNLAIALHKLSNHFNVHFLCLSDRTTPESKQKELLDEGVNVEFVEKMGHPDFRTARISKAKELHEKSDYIWVNQYENPANAQAHYETTGPEIWEQTQGNIEWVIASVGSGGTISGIAKYLKQKKPTINIVGVEPLGSTSFGGESHPYVSAGAGMLGASKLLKAHLKYIDYYAQVSDILAAMECKKFAEHEGISVGLTTGHCLAVASQLTNRPNETVVVVSADTGIHYKKTINNLVELPINSKIGAIQICANNNSIKEGYNAQ